jgi:hypothetical protein
MCSREMTGILQALVVFDKNCGFSFEMGNHRRVLSK